jgi:hypothetical protein
LPPGKNTAKTQPCYIMTYSCIITVQRFVLSIYSLTTYVYFVQTDEWYAKRLPRLHISATQS